MILSIKSSSEKIEIDNANNILALKVDLSDFNNIDNLSLSGKLLLKLVKFYQVNSRIHIYV